MSDLDKIYVFIPEYIKRKMEDDCDLFQIYKKNKKSINFNSFCNRLIVGYDELFSQENNKLRSTIIGELKDYVPNSESQERITTRLINEIAALDLANNSEENLVKIHFTPTNDSEKVVSKILSRVKNTRKKSEYFRRMFISYCSKPMYVREKIILSEKYREIEKACENGYNLDIITNNNYKFINVIPYKLAPGHEMFNYLVCVVTDDKTGEQETLPLKIHSISKYIVRDNGGIIENNVKKRLELMLLNGPQFAINKDERYCVRLTGKGVDTFKKIYFGRPITIERKKVGEDYYYYFNSSENQMYLYFRRFEPGQAEVKEPQELRDKIKQYHMDSLKIYEEG